MNSQLGFIHTPSGVPMDDDGALVDVGFALALIRLVTVEPIHSHIVSLSPKAFENFLPSFFKHLFFIRET
jgi:hypothetical protein